MEDAEAVEAEEQHLRRHLPRLRPVEDKARHRQPRRQLRRRHSLRGSRPGGKAVGVEDAEDAEAVNSRRRLLTRRSHSKPVSIAVSSQAANRWP